MSPHIEVELKVIEVLAPMVARTLDEPVALTLGGLNLLWHRCWSMKAATITRIGLAGIFGMEKLDLRVEALTDAGFLEPEGSAFRVKGAEKYLRIREGQSRGGHAAKGNLWPGGKRPKSDSQAEGGAEQEPSESRGGSRENGSAVVGSTPNTDHRTPNTKEEEAAPPSLPTRGPLVFEEPDTPPAAWTGQDFFAWFQVCRQSAGFVGEKWPKGNLSSWWSDVLMTPGMSVPRLQAAVRAFGASTHWRKKGLPFAGFMSQWREYVPAQEAAPPASRLPPPVVERLRGRIGEYLVQRLASRCLEWRLAGDVWVASMTDPFEVQALSADFEEAGVVGVRFEHQDLEAA